MEIALFIITGLALAITAFALWKAFLPKKELGQDPKIIELGAQVKIWSEESSKLRNDLKEEISSFRKESHDFRDKDNQEIQKKMEKFITGITQMEKDFEQIQKTMEGVSSFQEIFKSPKLTGDWGEASLDLLLSQYFPDSGRYEAQHQFKSGEKVDFVLKLPNEKYLPIDVKYPQDTFRQYIHEPNPENKEAIRKDLVAKVKKDIDDISSKYILPNEETVDFAMMYIPAESLYYEIVSKEDIETYARNKKVVLASPNNFILHIAIIQHWFKDADINNRTDLIIKRLQGVAADGGKLKASFRILGGHITKAQNSYEDTDKRLGLLVDRVAKVTNLIGETKDETGGSNIKSLPLNKPEVEEIED